MRSLPLTIIATSLLVAACSSDPTSSTLGDLQPDAPLPQTTGVFLGSYRVPTEARLASAATYPVDTVDWTVVGGVATLHYNLPVGLVGGTIPVTLSGAMSANSTTITLTGAAGTGACVASPTSITCREVFGDLGPLPISAAIVEQVAAREYAGPAADRLDVAAVFGSDPIGFVDVDLQTPVVDDHGGGGGGGGGGGSGSAGPGF